MTARPIREKSLRGEPPEPSRFLRSCAACGASFRAESGAPVRGLWDQWRWYCSIECTPATTRARWREEGWL